MKKLLLLFITLQLLNPHILYANLCKELSNTWVGTWEANQKGQPAKLKINFADAKHFKGEYFLSDGNHGDLAGECIPMKKNEAHLKLTQDPPLYNPCRGTIMKIKEKTFLHFYCFNPNEAGYFSPAIVYSCC